MNTAIPDLWPEKLVAPPPQPSPRSILSQQGYLLGQRTRNFVIGEVRTEPAPNAREFVHTFVVSAPVLNYREPILHVRTTGDGYPAEVAVYRADKSHRRTESVATAEAFMALLREELAHEETVKLVNMLASQSESAYDRSE